MPIDYRRYPADWKARRARVLDRARRGDDIPLCEHCGVPHLAVGFRRSGGLFVPMTGDTPRRLAGEGRTWPSTHPTTYREACEVRDVANRLRTASGAPGSPRWLVVVLTTAHLDRTGIEGPEDGPLDCSDDRLAALCQACHLRLDAGRRIVGAARTRLRRRAGGTLDLFASADA